MSERTLLLRDAFGCEHRVDATAEGVRVEGAFVRAERQPSGAIRLEDGRAHLAWAVSSGDARWVFIDGEVFVFETGRPLARRRRASAAQGSLTAPMPATVRQVVVSPGARVQQGDVLLVLEAMKMELPVRAPGDVPVAAVKCRQGELVQAGQELIELEPMIPHHVTIVEVGPRDGLQNEKATISTADKVAFVNLLSRTGLTVVEVTAFVSPKWVPQMADAADVLARIERAPATKYTALVPNLAGLERARAAGVTEVAIFAAASETFSRRNLNQSIDESLNTYSAVVDQARALGMRIRAYLSTAFGCPFEGPVDATRVAELSAALIEMGAYEVAVSDTIGIAHPGQVPVVLDAVLMRVPLAQIALHFHDTRGTALANVLVALQHGVARFDASCGGLGGCPYAPGATGNLATEDLVHMLDGLGIESGVRLDRMIEASRFIEPLVGHLLPSRYYRAARYAAFRLKPEATQLEFVASGSSPKSSHSNLWLPASAGRLRLSLEDFLRAP